MKLFFFLLSCTLIAIMTDSAVAQNPPFRLSLDGQWFFKADTTKTGIDEEWYRDSLDRSGWQPVETPHFWEWYPGLANFDGWGWFARTFRIEKVTDSLSIYFAGVDDDAVVWVNGTEVGKHSGYSDPFAVNISRAVHEGENLIVVQVLDFGGGGGIYKPITLIETSHLDDLVKSEFYGQPAIRSADWVRDATIYEVYLRSFSKEGTFKGCAQRIPELKELGVTVLWLMPIHPVGTKKRKGTLGSPYAVQDYYGVNPEFGTLDDFKQLVSTVHKNGMKIIIDLVANHTSWDSKLMLQHPGWFTKNDRGEIVSPNSDWTDVADLDYSQQGLRKYMIEMMAYWVRDIGIDGFRCDVAELVPTDFWNEARKRLNSIKPVMMLAEGSAPEHHVSAFDLSYSWNIYDALDPLLKGKKPVALLDQILKTEALQFPTGSLRMRFNTNHDKNAWDAPAKEKFGLAGVELSTVLINTLPGVPLLYTGEEVGNDRRLSLFEKVDVDWNRSRQIGELYATLFRLRKVHKALSRGEMLRIPSLNEDEVYAFFRIAGRNKILVVLSFSPDSLSTEVSIPFDTIFPGQSTVRLEEVFTKEGKEVGKETAEHVEFALKPFDYKVLIVKE